VGQEVLGEASILKLLSPGVLVNLSDCSLVQKQESWESQIEGSLRSPLLPLRPCTEWGRLPLSASLALQPQA
jgi:hypothetical protein